MQTSWVDASDGLLVYDYNADGIISEAKEFVFTMWGDNSDVATDMQALGAYFDTNKDGIFNSSDAAWHYFGVWQDLNTDGIHQEGEFYGLDHWGIESIALTYDEGSSAYAAAGGDVQVFGQMTVTYDDGTTGLAEDMAFTVQSSDLPASLTDSSATPDALDVHSLVSSYLNTMATVADSNGDGLYDGSHGTGELAYHLDTAISDFIDTHGLTDDAYAAIHQDVMDHLAHDLNDVIPGTDGDLAFNDQGHVADDAAVLAALDQHFQDLVDHHTGVEDVAHVDTVHTDIPS